MPVTFSWSVSSSPAPIDAGVAAAAATAGAEFGASALRDKALDPVDGDLLQSDGDQVYTYGVAGIGDHLQALLQVWLGECFLDTSKGVDYSGTVFTRFSNEGLIRAHFKAKILSCPGIVQVVELRVEKDKEAREISISFGARADTGDLIERTLAINFAEG